MRATLRLDGRDFEIDSPLDDVERLRDAMRAGAVTWHRLGDGGVLIVNWRATGVAEVDPDHRDVTGASPRSERLKRP